MADAPETSATGKVRGLVRSPLDLGGGLFLLAIAIVGYIGAFNLPFGHMNSIGSGLLPKSVAVLVGVFGIGIALQGFLFDGDKLESWGIRGAVFVLGAVLVFALTIRTLGLAFAGPLCVIVSAMADRDTRPVELAIFSVVMTALCIGLFKFLLRLPIPIFPPGYGPF
ncbi:MAG: tripartite tricarboxylate transporter TctB family protein [Hyphomicrobiaceae bacterium]|nr:tripartite tricarboxylate transporter TctB family protein [Hyphomicrobiaceae bacterium]